MDEKQFSHVLGILAQRLEPDGLDLWPSIRSRMQSHPLARRPAPAKVVGRRLRLAAALLLVLVLLFTITPPGRAWAPEIIRFFSHTLSDIRPLPQPAPTAPVASSPSPDPASILDAHLSVSEVARQAGFSVATPTWLPESLDFSGASYDAEQRIARVFYRSIETNGLVLAEEPLEPDGNCVLCGQVGASAQVETVRIGDADGEYVIGVWKMTAQGAVWDSDPYLQNLRWQAAGMAYSLQYMGAPGTLSQADLVAIAESLK